MRDKRNILLLEPNFKNKYPPIGLMKISTYHKELGDNVTFFKGDLKAFVLECVCVESIEKLKSIDNSIDWLSQQHLVKSYIKRKNIALFDTADYMESVNKPLIKDCLNYYRDYFIKDKYKQEPRWDRVYVTTLFTFHWDITIKTIEFAKNLVNDLEELKVGGVMASLIPNDIEKETGIIPIQGLLDKPSMLDSDNDIIIDDLPLDYSILDEIDHEYSTHSTYITYMTKGCNNKCPFCAVPKLEPIYKPKIPTLEKFYYIKKLYGDQQNLLLMDNNIFASLKFSEIIEEIKKMGFYKGATYTEPNQLEVSITNLQKGINDKAYTKRSYKLIHALLNRLKGKAAQTYYDFLDEFHILKYETTTKKNLLAVYPKIADTYERFRSKAPRLRYVDFNQGTDCRLITEKTIKLLSEIPIRPLRIAFDHIELEKQYRKAVELAAKYGIRELSNYILYNFKDSPADLYRRLKINIELCEKLDVQIYSFPMKYIPISGDESKNRKYVDKNWNKKFIGAIQAILNVTNGIVAPPSRNGTGRSFFEKAFGRNLQEFYELLYMPETYIVYRKLFEKELGYTDIWRNLFRNLSKEEFEEVKPIIEHNNFDDFYQKTQNTKILNLLNHYTITRCHVKKYNFKELRYKFDKLILQQGFNLETIQGMEDKWIQPFPPIFLSA